MTPPTSAAVPRTTFLFSKEFDAQLDFALVHSPAELRAMLPEAERRERIVDTARYAFIGSFLLPVLISLFIHDPSARESFVDVMFVVFCLSGVTFLALDLWSNGRRATKYKIDGALRLQQDHAALRARLDELAAHVHRHTPYEE